jgi:uncharacterized protein involved in exopolysaccharide biosynthesis
MDKRKRFGPKPKGTNWLDVAAWVGIAIIGGLMVAIFLSLFMFHMLHPELRVF